MRSFRQYVTLTEASAEKSMQYAVQLVTRVLEDVRAGSAGIDQIPLDDLHPDAFGDYMSYTREEEGQEVILLTFEKEEIEAAFVSIFNFINDSYDPTKGKYVVWLVNRYCKGKINRFEDFERAREALALFDAAKKSGWFKKKQNSGWAAHADINKFDGLVALEQFLRVNNLTDISVLSGAWEKHYQSGGFTLLWGTKEEYLIKLNTLEASVDLFRGPTSWCTARPGNSYFEGYSADGPLFVARSASGELVQIHIPSGQAMDHTDSQVHSEWLTENFPRQMEALQEYMVRHPGEFVAEEITKAFVSYIRDLTADDISILLVNPEDSIEWIMLLNPLSEVSYNDFDEDEIAAINREVLMAYIRADYSIESLYNWMRALTDREFATLYDEFVTNKYFIYSPRKAADLETNRERIRNEYGF